MDDTRIFMYVVVFSMCATSIQGVGARLGANIICDVVIINISGDPIRGSATSLEIPPGQPK